MNDTITDREELLLAKIAGKDVDIKTMTPGVASNLKEKLMLDIADRIDGIESSGGGSGLPEVSNADNGRVLKVESGEWTASALSPAPLIVNYTYSNGTYTTPLSFQEIYVAHGGNRPCSARVQEDLGGGNIMEVQLPLNTVLKVNGDAAALSYDTSIVSVVDGSLMVVNLTHSANGTITKTTYTAASQQ